MIYQEYIQTPKLSEIFFKKMTLNINDLWITSEKIHIAKAESNPVCFPKGGLSY